jgi:hypothetical protein
LKRSIKIKGSVKKWRDLDIIPNEPTNWLPNFSSIQYSVFNYF